MLLDALGETGPRRWAWPWSPPPVDATTQLRALTTIARHWAALDPRTRKHFLLTASTKMAQVVDGLAGSDEADVRSIVARIVPATGDARLLDRLSRLLADPDKGAAGQAEGSLLGLARSIARAIDASEDQWALPDHAGEIHQVMVDSARTFATHRRRGALLAAILSADPYAVKRAGSADPLALWLAEADDPSHTALRSVLRQTPDSGIRARAFVWLTFEPLATAALDRVARAEGIADHDAVLRLSHLALTPARARRLKLLRPRTLGDSPSAARQGPIPPRAAVPKLSVPARRGLPRWLASLSMDAPARMTVLESLLTDPDALTRLSAARVADARLLSDFAVDADPVVSRSAMRRASMAGVERRRSDWIAPVGLTRHADAAVRELAMQERDRADAWNAGSAASRLAAAMLLRADPKAFLAEVRARVVGVDQQASVAAIRMARALGLIDRVVDALIEVVTKRGDPGHPDRVAATAAAALGDSPSPEARQACLRSLSHADARVTANAVESLARAGRLSGGAVKADPILFATLMELKDSAHHRVRASAVHAALLGDARRAPTEASRRRVYEPAAADTLVAMLSDDREPHRIAGLWVTDRLCRSGRGPTIGPRWEDAAALASRLANDPSPSVAARGARLADRLMRAEREAWRLRVTPLMERRLELGRVPA